METKSEQWKKIFITILRVAIGWHFLYEGISKLMVPGWTSYNYLINTTSFASGFYHALASSQTIVGVVDFLNIWGLIGIGLALFLGVCIRYAAMAGTLLLILYYFAYPPFGSSLLKVTDGQFLFVDRNFLEALMLLVLLFLKEKGFGIDALWTFFRNRKNKERTAPSGNDETEQYNPRREILKNLVTLPVLGALGWSALQTQRKFGIDTLSGATIKLKTADLRKLEGVLPKGKIGPHEISRLIMGGNLIGGWAHSRDLVYVSSLFRAYNTEKKVFDTLILSEKAGINTINIGFASNELLAKYKKITGSKIKVISQIHPNLNNGKLSEVGPHTDKKLFFENIDKAIDYGVDIVQVQGNWCDWLVRAQKVEVIGEMIGHIRKQGYTAGLGAHSVESLIACADQGIIPDYYMKTMHHDQYWSAHPRENRVPFEVDGKEYLDHNRFHNNMFCLFPERVIDFVSKTKVPVMGFKVLAAGSIVPEDGFKWAFENGADFICVGMFDFQVVDDVNIAMATLKNLPDRKREWYG
jgi:uncharacterized membrane protein YphA (DoxX/SURF4 family)